MVTALVTNLVGLAISLAPFAVSISAWRRRNSLARMWFWIRAVVMLDCLWAVLCLDPGAQLALNACLLPVLSFDHVEACRRLARLRAALVPVVGEANAGRCLSRVWDGKPITIAAGFVGSRP